MDVERKAFIVEGDDYVAEWDSKIAASQGRMKQSRELRSRAERSASREIRRLQLRAIGALYDAIVGDFDLARATIGAIAPSARDKAFVKDLVMFAAAIAGSRATAEALIRTEMRVPMRRPVVVVQALLEIDAGMHRAATRIPPDAISDFRTDGLSEEFRYVYVRGLAYLHARDGDRAAALSTGN